MKKVFLLSLFIVCSVVFFSLGIQAVFAEEWCHNFNVNMKKGDRSDEVSALQTALIKEGLLDITAPTGYFWTLTFNAVVSFQEKYASEILIPIGLTKGT